MICSSKNIDRHEFLQSKMAGIRFAHAIAGFFWNLCSWVNFINAVVCTKLYMSPGFGYLNRRKAET